MSFVVFIVPNVLKCVAKPAEPTARRGGDGWDFSFNVESTIGCGWKVKSINWEFDEEVEWDEEGDIALILFVAIERCCCCCCLVVNFVLNGAFVKTSFDIDDWLFEFVLLLLLIPGG